MYAGIGMVVAHELSHAMDNTGRLFDSQGSYSDWWSPTSKSEFNQHGLCIVKEYQQPFAVNNKNRKRHTQAIPDSCPNENYGQQTLGEDIADTVGIRLAFETYFNDPAEQRIGKALKDAKQHFFYSFAQNW